VNELWLLAIVGAVFLLLFLVLLFRGRREPVAEPCAQVALAQVVALPGVNFGHVALLFDERDLKALECAPLLRPVAQQLHRDRRALLLLWLRHLQRDVLTLWRFRRLLTRSGVSGGLGEESRVAATAALALVLLASLRIVVATVSPFALVSFLRGAQGWVSRLSLACDVLLARVPASRWPDIERQWALTTGAVSRG
jgi:hypothetical protein